METVLRLLLLVPGGLGGWWWWGGNPSGAGLAHAASRGPPNLVLLLMDDVRPGKGWAGWG